MAVEWWKPYEDAVLVGALVAAVDSELLPMVRVLSVRDPFDVPRFGSNDIPLIDRAARTGNEEITMYFFDHAFDTRIRYGSPKSRTPKELHERHQYEKLQRAKWLATARNSRRSSQSPDPIIEEVNEAIRKVWIF